MNSQNQYKRCEFARIILHCCFKLSNRFISAYTSHKSYGNERNLKSQRCKIQVLPSPSRVGESEMPLKKTK